MDNDWADSMIGHVCRSLVCRIPAFLKSAFVLCRRKIAKYSASNLLFEAEMIILFIFYPLGVRSRNVQSVFFYLFEVKMIILFIFFFLSSNFSRHAVVQCFAQNLSMICIFTRIMRMTKNSTHSLLKILFRKNCPIVVH